MRVLRLGMLMALGAMPHGLGAQATAASLLGKMQSVAVYPVFSLAKSAHNYARTGQGIEFAFGVGEIRRPLTATERALRCARVNAALEAGQKPCNPNVTADTTRTLSELRRAHGTAGFDSIYTVTIDASAYRVTVVSFELAVATQTTDLRHIDATDDWELSGKVQEFPVLALYATFRPDWFVSPYLGVKYAQADLKNVRIVQADSTATVETSTTGGAVALGGVIDVHGFNIFAEAAYSYLRFPTSRWKVPGNLTPQPASFPTFIELTGPRFSLGVQLTLDFSQ